jgi:hypothetical protein
MMARVARALLAVLLAAGAFLALCRVLAPVEIAHPGFVLAFWVLLICGGVAILAYMIGRKT